MEANMPRKKSNIGPPSTDIEKHNEVTKINPNYWSYEDEAQDS